MFFLGQASHCRASSFCLSNAKSIEIQSGEHFSYEIWVFVMQKILLKDCKYNFLNNYHVQWEKLNWIFFIINYHCPNFSLCIAMVDCHFQLVKSGMNGHVYDFQLSINLKGIFLKRMALLKCQKLGHD